MIRRPPRSTLFPYTTLFRSHLDLEKALAADGDVEVVAGLRQRARRHQPRGANGLDTAAEIDADGQARALVGGLRADPADVVVDQVLKRRALLLEAGGAQVRDVVGDDLDVELLGRHSRRRGMKSLHGSVSLKHDPEKRSPVFGSDHAWLKISVGAHSAE